MLRRTARQSSTEVNLNIDLQPRRVRVVVTPTLALGLSPTYQLGLGFTARRCRASEAVAQDFIYSVLVLVTLL